MTDARALEIAQAALGTDLEPEDLARTFGVSVDDVRNACRVNGVERRVGWWQDVEDVKLDAKEIGHGRV